MRPKPGTPLFRPGLPRRETFVIYCHQGFNRRAGHWLLEQPLPTGLATWFHTRASWWIATFGRRHRQDLKDPTTILRPCARWAPKLHSPVGVAEGAPSIRMSRMNRFSILAPTRSPCSRAIAIRCGPRMQKHGMQFYVNTRSEAVGGQRFLTPAPRTLHAGEYGQVGSYITNIKMVLPSASYRSLGPPAGRVSETEY